MKLKLSRRGVYVATIVAMFAMIGGFALATGLFGGFGSTNVNGNQGTVSVGNTIYSPGISTSDYTSGAGGALGVCTGPASSGVATVTVTAWVQGGPGACTTTADYVLQLTFTSGTLASSHTYTDDFVVSAEFGSATTYTTSSASIACTLGASGTVCQAIINIDTGVPTTDAQPTVNAVDITVTGS
jgi:hypothetical protein